MNIWLDDVRTPPDGWTWVKTAEEVISLLESRADIIEIDLDHDLGEYIATGYEVLIWIERQVACNGYDPPKMKVHTANPPGHLKMVAAIDRIERLHSEK